MNWGTVPEWIAAAGLVVLAYRMRPRRPRSGTHVMPLVKLPEGYEPPSAAVRGDLDYWDRITREADERNAHIDGSPANEGGGSVGT